MTTLVQKSFGDADEIRSLDKTTVEVLQLPLGAIGRFTFEPGWKWSECVGPKVGTDTCQATHLGAVVSGHIHIVHDDGTSIDAGPGDAYVVHPGHDAWVVGDEPFVGLEFQDPGQYARVEAE